MGCGEERWVGEKVRNHSQVVVVRLGKAYWLWLGVGCCLSYTTTSATAAAAAAIAAAAAAAAAGVAAAVAAAAATVMMVMLLVMMMLCCWCRDDAAIAPAWFGRQHVCRQW